VRRDARSSAHIGHGSYCVISQGVRRMHLDIGHVDSPVRHLGLPGGRHPNRPGHRPAGADGLWHCLDAHGAVQHLAASARAPLPHGGRRGSRLAGATATG